MKTEKEAEGRELLARQLTSEKSRAGYSGTRAELESLKKSLVAAWKKIPQEVIDRAVDAFPKKLQKCIDAGGGHFENQ